MVRWGGWVPLRGLDLFSFAAKMNGDFDDGLVDLDRGVVGLVASGRNSSASFTRSEV